MAATSARTTSAHFKQFSAERGMDGGPFQSVFHRVARRQPAPSLGSFIILGTALLAIGCQRRAPYEGKTVAQLSAMLRDPDPAVQTQGAYGLSRLGADAKAAVPSLI